MIKKYTTVTLAWMPFQSRMESYGSSLLLVIHTRTVLSPTASATRMGSNGDTSMAYTKPPNPGIRHVLLCARRSQQMICSALVPFQRRREERRETRTKKRKRKSYLTIHRYRNELLWMCHRVVNVEHRPCVRRGESVRYW